jgi:hypothetical protein
MRCPCHEQHHLAGAPCGAGGLGHGLVACHLDAGHAGHAGLGQQAAVPVAHGLVLALQGGGAQQRFEAGVGLRGAQLGPGQVAAQHRYARAHRRHGHGAVVLPRPERLAPAQCGLHLGLAGLRRQALGAAACFGHLHHQRRQQPALGQPLHRLALHVLVLGGVVAFAQQQYFGGQQALQCLGARSAPRCGVGSVRSRPGSSGWSAAPLPVEVQMLSTCRDATTAAWRASGNVPIPGPPGGLHGLVPGRAHVPMPMKQNITIDQIQTWCGLPGQRRKNPQSGASATR